MTRREAGGPRARAATWGGVRVGVMRSRSGEVFCTLWSTRHVPGVPLRISAVQTLSRLLTCQARPLLNTCRQPAPSPSKPRPATSTDPRPTTSLALLPLGMPLFPLFLPLCLHPLPFLPPHRSAAGPQAPLLPGPARTIGRLQPPTPLPIACKLQHIWYHAFISSGAHLWPQSPLPPPHILAFLSSCCSKPSPPSQAYAMTPLRRSIHHNPITAYSSRIHVPDSPVSSFPARHCLHSRVSPLSIPTHPFPRLQRGRTPRQEALGPA